MILYCFASLSSQMTVEWPHQGSWVPWFVASFYILCVEALCCCKSQLSGCAKVVMLISFWRFSRFWRRVIIFLFKTDCKQGFSIHVSQPPASTVGLEQQFVFPLRTSMVFSNSVFADHSRVAASCCIRVSRYCHRMCS